MSSPHPLNQAVVQQALHDLRNGQLRRCLSMGFNKTALEALKQPSLVSLLSNASVAWCSVRVNLEVLQRLLEQVRDVEKEIQAIDRMLILGASTEMVAEFHGLTHQEVALRRQVLRLPQRKGRWPVMSEAQDTGLWQSWRSGVTARGLALQLDAAMLGLGMELAEAQHLPLSVVWSAIQHWIEQKLT
jgi:hypothetical protein